MLFVREVLGADPDDKQTEALTAVRDGERRISIRSGHGVGKTTVLAWIIIWWFCTRFPQKTVCTAPTSDQLFDALASEVKAWITKMTPQLQELFEVQSEAIFFRAAPDESFISFRTSRPEKPEALAGVHSKHVLLVGDEASGIPEAVFESAIGSMSGHSAVTILAGNPVRSSGTFFDSHMKPDVASTWKKIHISCVNHPRVTPDFVDDVRRRYGERSNAFRVRVLGEFPLADDDTVIPFELLEAARKREVTPLLVRPVWGLDVARFGSDASALARRIGNVCGKVEQRRGFDIMQTAGWVKHEWDITPSSERPSDINVDVIGMGAGVVDRLRELGLPANGINVSESPVVFNERYLNFRAELWFRGLDWFAARDCRIEDEDLALELGRVKYKFTSVGKIQIESKEEMKKRGFESPNRADAFLLTLATEAVSAMGYAKSRTSWKAPLKRIIKGVA